MAAESAPPPYGPLDFEDNLAYSMAARTVGNVQLDQKTDTLYDQFLHAYLGSNPYMEDAPAIHRQGPDGQARCYDVHILRSYSKGGLGQRGQLVNVRTTSEYEPGAAYYFVATADLATEQITEWPVWHVRHRGEGDSLQTELLLESPDTLRPDLTQLQAPELQMLIDQWPHKIVLTNGRSVYVHAGVEEGLNPIHHLAEEVERLIAKEKPTVEANRQRVAYLAHQAAEQIVAGASQPAVTAPLAPA